MSEKIKLLTIYEQMKATGAYMSSHESDLYVEITEETSKIVENHEYKNNITTFHDEVTQKMCYDIPFAYTPWWEKKTKSMRESHRKTKE